MTDKPFKPSIPFLRKVEAERVYNAFLYRRRTGGQHKTAGGENAIRAHAAAGLITRPGTADLGRPSYARLTDAGRALLAAVEASAPHIAANITEAATEREGPAGGIRPGPPRRPETTAEGAGS